MSIQETLKEYLIPLGFEIYEFKIGWYNDSVSEAFKFDLPYDTLSFNILSTPRMFEHTFKPFISQGNICKHGMDPLDHCLKDVFNHIKLMFPNNKVNVIHDFEMNHSRRPKVLVQTAGHIAGAAFYYQRKYLTNDPWPLEKKIYGVSIHPKYGGWFAFRGVIVFEDILCTKLERPLPSDVLGNESKVITLLSLFNESWQDYRYRDIIVTPERYSEEQILYFKTIPKQRLNLIEHIKKN